MSAPLLYPLLSSAARCRRTRPGAWQLSVPEGPTGVYRVAQLDDYSRFGRRAFRWRAPVELQVRARVSAADLPGTWGFGFWNDPFSRSFGSGASQRLPTLPNAAWFFYASPPNYLSLSNDHPAQGLLAATFAAPRLPALLLLAALPALPLLAWRVSARLLRWVGRKVVREDAAALSLDPTDWHTYRLGWHRDHVAFTVDDEPCLVTPVSPDGPLGLVLWIDNQTMALPPDGRLQFGVLGGPEAWLELEALSVSEAVAPVCGEGP
jgi:hypothetical protein